MELLERNELLKAAKAVTAAARAGRGRVLAFEGPAGIGKSTLLAAAVDQADGMRVVLARPTELERTFAFGVARRLLSPLTRQVPSRDARSCSSHAKP
jgi:predicted ATPase